MFQVKADNKNYAAKVVKLDEIVKHPNADKLQIATVLGYKIITGLDAAKGQLYVYFPQESQINNEYLSWSNSFSDAELNTDKTKKGFFPSSGRVKAVKLRGASSEGYIIPVKNICDWLNEKKGMKVFPDDFSEGTDFDFVNNIWICKKYVNQAAYNQIQRALAAENRKNKKVARESKIVPNQFRLHEDTEALKRNVSELSPEDIISITYKMHGCQASISYVLCKRTLAWHEKVLIKLGVNINQHQYDYVWASRRVLKNAYADQQHQSFYDVDIWSIIAEKYKGTLEKGITLYGEIVNQLPNGKWIQKSYDYSLPPNVADFYVYRITNTNVSGDVIEFTWPQIERYCKKRQLKTTPMFYYGKAKDWDRSISVDEHWHKNFLAALMAKYTEKECFMCANKVPEEGVVLVKESDFFKGFKLKSLKFLARESEELDKGETNIEDEQSTITNGN
jgi:hypothetical protein